MWCHLGCCDLPVIRVLSEWYLALNYLAGPDHGLTQQWHGNHGLREVGEDLQKQGQT